MASPSLPLSRLIAVSVTLTPTAAQAQNLSTLLLLGSSSVIDVVERYRDYSSLEEVANQFGTSAAEYLAANLYFQQVPQPTRLRIGRWAQTATAGVLKGASLSAAQQLLTNFTAITSGGFTYTRNGGVASNITGINLSAATNLNGVASIITTALGGNATMVWNAAFSRFELTSNTTGSTSSISFLSAPGSGTDISGLLGMLSTSSGAYRADGIVAESALACVQLFDSTFGQSWYAAVVLGAQNSDHLAIAAYLEATDTKHVYGVTTQEAGALVAATTTDIAYLLKQGGYDRTLVVFSSASPYAVVSALARMLTVDYTGNSTAITLMYKQTPGVLAETLNATQAAALEGKNCNALVQYNNATAIVQRGVMASGEFADNVMGTDWLAVTIQTSVYNLLYTSTTKIPQTDAGVRLITTTIEAVCAQGVVNGLLAPGVWNSNGFGLLRQGDFMAKGYYIHAQRVAEQNPSDRAARRAPPIQVAAKLAGAVHDVRVSVTVNQ